jgi:hypothetical protein
MAAAKLTRHPRFGCLTEVPFEKIAERVKSLEAPPAPETSTSTRPRSAPPQSRSPRVQHVG